MSKLAQRYLAERPDAGPPDALADALERLVEAARSELGDVPVDGETLAAALAGLPEPAARVSEASAVELALALACGQGERAALDRLEDEYLDGARAALRAMKLTPELQEEVLQETRHKLLVGEPPKLVGYAGRGSLRGLLKVTATRTAISMLRKAGREAPGDDAVLDATGERDPELSFLKRRYRAVFRDAFEEAVAGLDPRERNLLRLHFLRRVTLEQLATMYGVHRATIVRHLAKIRTAIEKATRAGLSDRLEADRREVESVLDLIRSRYDVSVERMLATRDG